MGDTGPTVNGETDSGTLHIRFPLSGGNTISIFLESKVTPADFDRIIAMLELSKDAITKRD